MDIDKLKSAVEIKLNQARVVKVPNYITSGLTEEADKIFIDLATQVIEVSEAMPKKREVVGRDPYNTTDAMNDSFNQCHDEFVLWLTKRLEGLLKMIKNSLSEEEYTGHFVTNDVGGLAQAIREFILGGEK